MRAGTISAVLAITLFCSEAAGAWEVEYDASAGVLPTAALPSWDVLDYGAPVALEDNTLHIGISSTGGLGYCREVSAIADGTPVTVEARLRVLSPANGFADLWIGTCGGYAYILVSRDQIRTKDRYLQWHSFSASFADFHAVRIAYDGAASAYVWVDDQFAFSYPVSWFNPAGRTDVGIRFGSVDCDSYWQYVAYSKEFLPIPEPPSLLALLAGLGGFGMLLRRRGR